MLASGVMLVMTALTRGLPSGVIATALVAAAVAASRLFVQSQLWNGIASSAASWVVWGGLIAVVVMLISISRRLAREALARIHAPRVAPF